MKIGIRAALASCLALTCAMACADVPEERLRDLECLCACIPNDDLDANIPDPTPESVKAKYNISNSDIVDGLVEIVARLGVGTTNQDVRETRETAVYWIGRYGTSNDVGRLSAVVTNAYDHAQRTAVVACMTMLKASPGLIGFIRNVSTNEAAYSASAKEGMYIHLRGMMVEVGSDCYVTDETQRARVASFFLERAAVEQTNTLFVDRCAWTLNPWYRHSQQRRDNLAALRPPGLTGKPAELYDAAQRDAAQEE